MDVIRKIKIARGLARRMIGRWRVLISTPKGGICAEIGVWQGEFSGRILKTAHPRELHLVDPWLFAPHYPKRLWGGAVAKNQADMDAMRDAVARKFSGHPEVKIHRATSTEAANGFPNHYFDWIYIDGDHSYEAVLEDLRAWYPKMKPGGLICLDDLYWKDERGEMPVQAAIQAFLARTKVTRAKTLQRQFLIEVAR